ncbi:MAG: methyltransferase domain-containing protein [Fibrobacterota bacterium]
MKLSELVNPLRYRSRASEIMDDPACDREQLYQTLDDFVYINRWLSRSAGLLQRTVIARMRKDPHRQYSLLEVGAGGGDTALLLDDLCRQQGLICQITCCEMDSRTLAYLRNKTGNRSRITVIDADIRTFTVGRPWDFVFANHLLHHLGDDEIPTMLQTVFRLAREGVVISDLRRSRRAWLLFALLSRIFFRAGFTSVDGLISIERSFRVDELNDYIRTAGLSAALVARRAVPFRTRICSRNFI